MYSVVSGHLPCQALAGSNNGTLTREDGQLRKSGCKWAALPASSATGSGRSVAWLARVFRVHEVVSSNLTAPTMFLWVILEKACLPNRFLTESAHVKEAH